MKFDKQKYNDNEKLVFNIALGILIGGFVLFGLTILAINTSDILVSIVRVIAALGLLLSIAMIIAGNVRLIRFVAIIRKENTEVVVWKSALAVALGLTSLIVYWFIFLILVLESL